MAKEEVGIYEEAAKWALSMRDVQHPDMGSLVDQRCLLFSESMKIFCSCTLTTEMDASERVSGPQLFASQILLDKAQEELINFKVPKAEAKTFYRKWIDNAQASLIIRPFSYFKNPKSAQHILKQQFVSCFTMTYQHHHIIFLPKYIGIFHAWKIYPPHRSKEYQLFITKAKRLVFTKLYQNWCPRVPKPLPDPLAAKNEELEPVGLENTHNTCFMNSVMQSIMYTTPFYNALIFDSHDSALRCNQIGHFCALCAVERLVVEVHTTSFTMILPSYLSDHLQNIMTNHLEGDHEDPIDFLDHFIESLRSCTAGAEKCHLDDIFRFCMEKKVKCCICEYINDIKIEEFRWLSLAIRNCQSVEEALTNFCDTIKLETDCRNCGGIGCNCIGYTTYKIGSPILIIQLKRFDMVNGCIVKLEDHISFPLLLDLENPLWIFRLHGMVVHHGHAITEGHYTAFVCGKWYKVDDSEVDEIEGFNYVQQQQAYLLVYLREAKAM